MEAGQACVSPAASNSYFGAYYFVLVFLLINLLTSFVLESVLSCFDRADAAAAAAAADTADAAAGGGSPSPRERRRSDSSGPPEPHLRDVAAQEEAAADEAERFAALCAERLRAEGNTSVVSVRPKELDGYAALVRLLSAQRSGGGAPALLRRRSMSGADNTAPLVAPALGVAPGVVS